MSLPADGSRADADARKASRPVNATAVVAGASEARSESRRRGSRVWGGGRAMVTGRPGVETFSRGGSEFRSI